MKLIQLILCLVLLNSCSHSKYILKTEQELSRINWETTKFNYIPILKSDIDKSIILGMTNVYLEQRQLFKLKKYLKSNSSNSNDFFLAKTIYYMYKTDYTEAQKTLLHINDEKYLQIKQLLSVDLNHEISKENDTHNYQQTLNEYQYLFDANPSNTVLKNILLTRVRYTRYNY